MRESCWEALAHYRVVWVRVVPGAESIRRSERMENIFAGHLGLHIFSVDAARVFSLAPGTWVEAESTGVGLGAAHASEVSCGIVGESSV